MKTPGVVLAITALGLVVFGLGASTLKVRNELKMTSAYERQASALERIADAAERAHPPILHYHTETVFTSSFTVQSGGAHNWKDSQDCRDDAQICK